MAVRIQKTLLGALLLLLVLPAVFAMGSAGAPAGRMQSSPVAGSSGGQMTMMISDEVRHRLLMIPYYGIFDWLECEIRPDRVAVLRGEVTRPEVKSDAGTAIKKIEGIPRVDNQIEVLPVSTGDDRIRIAVYRAIFRYEGPLFRYAIQASAPIHIIVNNGRVTLKGNVDSAADSQLAFMAANGVSGVFEVKNELRVGK